MKRSKHLIKRAWMIWSPSTGFWSGVHRTKREAIEYAQAGPHKVWKVVRVRIEALALEQETK